MAEVGIGVLFAIWFIVIYLIVNRLRQRDRRSYGPVSLAPPDTTKLIGAQQPKRFLTTAAMSEHHSPKKDNAATEGTR